MQIQIHVLNPRPAVSFLEQVNQVLNRSQIGYLMHVAMSTMRSEPRFYRTSKIHNNPGCGRPIVYSWKHGLHLSTAPPIVLPSSALALNIPALFRLYFLTYTDRLI